MKTSIKTIFATALTALVLSTSAFARTANPVNPVIDATDISAKAMNINMVIVDGHIDVYLIKGKSEDIKIVSNGIDQPNVSIKKKGAKLYITGADNERVTMYVYVKDLKRIEAHNTAKVRTQGEFKVDALQILLHDDAKANVNVNTNSLYTVIKDNSSLKLSGTTGSHNLSKERLASLNMNNFNATTTTAATITPKYAVAKKMK